MTSQKDWSPPLRDADSNLPLELYAAVGDGRSVALVGADGSIDWLGVPGLDCPPFFDRLLDPEHGGRFSVTPRDPFEVERRYLPDSNVVEQVFITASGRARVTDSLNSGISGRLPWCELARRIEGLDGEVALEIRLLPSRRLDSATPWREETHGGDVLHLDGVIASLRFSDDIAKIDNADSGALAEIVTKPGSRSVVALLASRDEPLIVCPMATIDTRIDRSDKAWREWASNLSVGTCYPEAVRRSALALKLLLFSPTGAIAAAATTSLPERCGGDKNWDYRFAWTRDVAYTIKAFLSVGAVEEAKAAFSWLTATVLRHEGGMRVMYQLDGSLVPGEKDLALPGYAGSQPVRCGNRARDQLQLGTYGDVLMIAAMFVEAGHILDLVTRSLLANLANRCADLWRRKDGGIWELVEEEHYTLSKIGCWTALDMAVSLAKQEQILSAQAHRWERERDRIRDWVDANCWSERKQAYTLYAGTEKLDAALTLALFWRFTRTDRLALTCEAIKRELAHKDSVALYRYSGMEKEEGTFTACGFWMVEAEALIGNLDAARARMDAMLKITGHNLGLLTEMLEPDTGRMLGNTPQALSHLALVLAADAIEQETKRQHGALKADNQDNAP